MNKYVKLDAIERLAQPMEKFHGKSASPSTEEYADGGKDWECPKCGTSVMATNDMNECECPCCGAEMEPAEDTEEDVQEDAGEETDDESED